MKWEGLNSVVSVKMKSWLSVSRHMGLLCAFIGVRKTKLRKV